MKHKKPMRRDKEAEGIIYTYQCIDCEREFAAAYQAKGHAHASGHWVRKL